MCFDHSSVEISGGFNSLTGSKLAINFKIPEDECRRDPYDTECVASAGFEERLKYTNIVALTNRMRFD